MNIFISVGEPSGDVHGANIVRALRRQAPDVQCIGFAGPRMVDAGCVSLFDLTQLPVMWLADALWNLRTFFRLADQAEQYFHQEKPDAVILIDYPGFHWHLARRAKRLGIPVYYYSPPQVWAWKQSRVQKMRRDGTLVFSGLPFETEWLQEHGCSVEYVGHPFFDEVQNFDKALFQREPHRVGLLPGSRMKEVQRHVPVFLSVVEKVRRKCPEATFVFAAFNEPQAEWIRNFLRQKGETAIPVEVGRTPEILQTVRCCLSVSGSVSLELLYYETPAVMVYQIPRYANWIQWFFRRVRYITLVNLLVARKPFCRFPPSYSPHGAEAEEVLFPEYLTSRDRTNWMAEDLLRWLQKDTEWTRCVERLQELKSRVAQRGAAEKAACRVLKGK